MSKHGVKKLPDLLRYVPDQYKNQLICDNVILENGGTLKSVPDCYRNQKLCNQTINNYHHALEFVSECYKTQKFMMKLSILSILKFVPDLWLEKYVINQLIDVFCIWCYSWSIQNLRMYDRVVSEYPFLIVYCPE